MQSPASTPQILPRPRILVCAPSNAAVDEIVSRVGLERLLDGNGRPYTPDIVRIGRSASIRDGAVKDNISLDVLVEAFFRYNSGNETHIGHNKW
jgi:senataxin